MRKFLFFFVTVVMLCSFSIIVYADEQTSLYDMSEDECFDILLEQGLEVPKCFENYSEIKTFAKNIVCWVIDDPSREDWFNFTESQRFATDIRQIVLDYENIEVKKNNYVSLTELIRVTSALQYSTLLYDRWVDTYSNYNCYTYALYGTCSVGYNPGTLAGVYISSVDYPTMTIQRLASIVSYDLQELGCTNIYYGTSFPDSSRLGGNYKLIAVRKCDYDYHFMSMVSFGTWQWNHKPSSAVPMKYNYTSLYSGSWTSEGLYREGFRTGTTVYNSDIVYISYLP